MKEEIECLEMDDSILVWGTMNTGRKAPIIWLFCAKPNCTTRTYHDSDFCYPHTKKDESKLSDKVESLVESL